jgi:hypothetical protein
MAPNVKENEFKGKGADLLRELKERVRHLKETEGVVGDLLKLIDESESLLSSNPEESEKKYDEVLNKIGTIEISHRAKPLAWRLLWIELGYLASLLLLGYLTYRWPDFLLWKGLMDPPVAMHLQTAWFGALGGITIAIYGIYEHVHLRDFDPQYELWYICKPLIGGIFGWFIYLIFYIGLVSVQGPGKKGIDHPELPYVIAFLAGFSERFTLKLVDKLMGVLTTWEDKSVAGNAQKEKKETVK